MSEEIEAILRAEYEHETDIEQAIRRLHETNERLRTDPAQRQRIRDIIEAVDAETENRRDTQEPSAADAATERDLFTELLADSERLLGLDHPEVLRIRASLAHWTREAGDVIAGPRVIHAQFGEAVTDLLEAAGLSVDDLVRGTRRPGDARLSRSALNNWKRGRQLPSDTASLLAVVRVCLTAEALWSPRAHRVLFRAGYSMEEAGLVNTALGYWQEVLSASEQRLGPKDPDTLAICREVAYCRGQAGDPGSAVDELKNLLTDQLRTKERWHPEILRIRRELAWWRGEKRDPVGAVADYEELLDDMLDVFGPDDYETLSVRYDLGRWRGQSGRPQDAVNDFRELYQDAQDLGLRFDGRLILAVRNDLAWWLGESGDAAAAVAEFEELLSVRQRKLGKDHPFTLATRHDLAWWKWDAGNQEAAKSELEKVLDDYQRLLEPGHPQTAAVREDLNFLITEGQDGVPHGEVRDTRQQRVSGDLPGLDFLRPMDRLADTGSIQA